MILDKSHRPEYHSHEAGDGQGGHQSLLESSKIDSASTSQTPQCEPNHSPRLRLCSLIRGSASAALLATPPPQPFLRLRLCSLLPCTSPRPLRVGYKRPGIATIPEKFPIRIWRLRQIPKFRSSKRRRREFILEQDSHGSSGATVCAASTSSCVQLAGQPYAIRRSLFSRTMVDRSCRYESVSRVVPETCPLVTITS